jgi:predicted phosphodiesterase
MRIIVTSDLHYDVLRSRKPTETLAREVCRLGGDVLMVLGDSASADLAILEQVLGLFEPFGGLRLAVAGNHELWTLNGQDSLRRYEVDLAEACRRAGFHYLDGQPAQLDGTAFVGNIGWYDFSFRPSALGVPLRFYEHKVAPGAAAYYPEYHHLIEGQDDIPPSAWNLTCRWMDGERVKLPFDDVEFTHRAVARLRDHLRQVHDRAERVIVGMHHLPFAELVPRTLVPNLEFAAGFLGSELFGEALLDFAKVSHVFCGHSHKAKTCRKGSMICTAVGSTYREKRYEALQL